MHRIIIITSTLLAGFATLLSGQTTWHVATNGVDTNTGLDWNSPYLTISKAVGQAVGDDAIIVSNGLYETSASIVLSKAVHLRSVNGPEVTTVKRSGAANYRLFQITGVQASISGFTVTNGNLSSGPGAGLHMDTGVVSNCIFTGNSSTSHGGGIYCGGGVVTHCRLYGNSGNNGGGIQNTGGLISNCRIEQNTANYGGGVDMKDNAIGIYNSVICNNTASDSAGGIYIYANTGTVYNCQVYSNTAAGTRGGGIYVNNCAARLENITVFGNRTEVHGSSNINGGGGLWASCPAGQKVLIRNALIYNNYSHESGGGIYSYSSSIIENSTIVSNYAAYSHVDLYGGGGGLTIANDTGTTNTITNCIIQFNDCVTGADNWQFRKSNGNVTYTNNCMGPGANRNVFLSLPTASYGGGNFSDDPLFVNRASNDWRLQRGSPCINAGIQQDWMASALDLDGLPRLDVINGTVDLGCYENENVLYGTVIIIN